MQLDAKNIYGNTLREYISSSVWSLTHVLPRLITWDGQIEYASVQKNFYSVWNFGLYGFLSSLIANLVIISRLKHLKGFESKQLSIWILMITSSIVILRSKPIFTFLGFFGAIRLTSDPFFNQMCLTLVFILLLPAWIFTWPFIESKFSMKNLIPLKYL